MDRKVKKEMRERRHRRVRAKISGTHKVPRLCVFRSIKYIYVQLIDDEKGKIIAAAKESDLAKEKKTKKQTEEKDKSKNRKIAIAFNVGKLIAQKAEKIKIKKVVFDRGGYKYHGRVKALAEGAKEQGLKF